MEFYCRLSFNRIQFEMISYCILSFKNILLLKQVRFVATISGRLQTLFSFLRPLNGFNPLLKYRQIFLQLPVFRSLRKLMRKKRKGERKVRLKSHGKTP